MASITISASAGTGASRDANPGETVSLTINVTPSGATGLALDDFTASEGTVQNLVHSHGGVYVADWIMPNSGSARNLTLTLRENAVSGGNVEVELVIRLASSVTLSASSDSASRGGTVTITATFFNNKTGLELTGFSTDHGTLSNLQGSNKIWTVDLTLPSTGAGTAIVTLLTDATSEGNPSATISIDWYDAITQVVPQIFVVDTAFNLPVSVNAPTGKTISKVNVRGLLEGWTHSKNIAADKLSATPIINGTPIRVASGALSIEVLYTDNTRDASEIEWQVINPSPVFAALPKIELFQNIQSNILLLITNYEGGAAVRGPLVGFLSEDFQEEDDGAKGVRILMTPDQIIADADNENFELTLPNPMPGGAPIVFNQPFRVIAGTPPAMPAVSVATGTGCLTFSWAAVTGANSYAYRRDMTSAWVDVGNVTSYTVCDLQAGVSHTYHWRVNSHWIGDSVSASGTPPVPATKPAQITTFTLARGYRKIDVSITPPSNGGSTILRYEYSLDSGSWIIGGSEPSFTISELLDDTSYSVRTRAVNAIGEGDASTSMSVTTASKPSKVTGVSINRISSGEVEYVWNEADDNGAPITVYLAQDLNTGGGGALSGYTVQNGVARWRSTAPSLTVPGRVYRVQISARNAVGGGPWSNTYTYTHS